MRYLNACSSMEPGAVPLVATIYGTGYHSLLRRKFAGLQCAHSVGLWLQVYAACVPPVASYGCELWGHRPLPGAVAKVRGSLSQVHVRHLRGICGLRANVPATIVLAEVQQVSLQQIWWSRLVHFGIVLLVFLWIHFITRLPWRIAVMLSCITLGIGHMLS